MTYVRTLEDFTPPVREDNIPFTIAVIQESASDTGPWATIDTIPLDPIDTDPAHPQTRSFTTSLATLDPVAWYRVQWQDANAAEFNSDPVYFPATPGAYTTPHELRTELTVDATVLTDEDANQLIATAEDLIDEDLGARPVDIVTGRKVIRDQVEVWQWTKLARATVKLAALLYRKPDLLAQRYTSVRGPDFAFSGPVGSRFGDEVDAPLNQSGLRRLTTTVAGRADRPPWYGFVVNDTSWDYDPPPLPRQSTP